MQALKSAGQNVDLEIITGVDHFDLVERLPDPDYSLAQASTVFLLPLTHPRLQTADVPYMYFLARNVGRFVVCPYVCLAKWSEVLQARHFKVGKSGWTVASSQGKIYFELPVF